MINNRSWVAVIGSVMIVVLFFIGSTFILFWISSPTNSNSTFLQAPLNIVDYALFDLGVADVNGDRILDLYTSNHSSPQNVLLGNGNGTFRDVFSQWQLDQDSEFPGMARIGYDPPMNDPGLYIHFRGETLILRAYQLSNLDAMVGSIRLLSPVSLEDKQSVDIKLVENKLRAGATETSIEFQIKRNGFLELKPYLAALPISFKLDEDWS